MSMSQEEIEALMSGIEEESSPVAEEEIPAVDENVEDTSVTDNDIASLIAQESNISEESNDSDETNETQINEILNSLDISDTNEDSINDLIEESALPIVENIKETPTNVEHEDIGKNWAENKIEKGVFPFPVDKDTQVVNQLSQVANDSEEKASQIFDVLSLVLDNNDLVSKEIKPVENFITNQIVLLEILNKKFPNISQFKENLDLANNLKDNSKNILNNIDAENMEIFGAMELMQFNDINRQKIERVMSVIRKLSSYLNNLFEDDNSHKDIAIAKHISGDSNTDLVEANDLESLIDEYSKG